MTKIIIKYSSPDENKDAMTMKTIFTMSTAKHSVWTKNKM